MKTYIWRNNLMICGFMCALLGGFADTSLAEVIDPPVISELEAQTAMVGVPFTLTLSVTSDSPLKSVTVTGLPSGLKYDAMTMTIKGAPTVAASSKTVTVTAKNAAKTPDVLTFNMSIEALPAWAQGSFRGSFSGELGYGTVSADVTPQGKISGKFSTSGKNYNFSAASYAQRDEEGAFWFSVEGKTGKTVQPLTFRVWKPENNPDIPDVIILPPNLSIVDMWLDSVAEGDPVAKMYRNVWKDKDTDIATTLAPYIGYYTAVLPGGDEYGSGYLTFTVDGAGCVKTAGKLADGTALSMSGTLILDDIGRVFAVIYTSPTAYKGGCFFGLAEFFKPENGTAVILHTFDETPFFWQNLNLQATADYMGFERELVLSGGWYDKLINLRNFYENGLAVGGIGSLPQMLAAVRYTDYDWNSESETPPKISWTEEMPVDSAGAAPNGLMLTVTGDGTGLAAPSAQTPTKVIDPETGEYWGYYNYYDLVNPSGLAISFTRATGIFKGSFNVYYDYVSAQDLTSWNQTQAHVTKKASYEGVLTPVREDQADGIEGRGFYLWPAKSSYDSGRIDKNWEPILTSYSFNWSYDFLLQSGQ